MSPSPFSFQPISQQSPAVRLLNNHDTGHGMFISHLDRHPVSVKFLVFLPPFFMHLALASVMAWRIFSGIEHYSPAVFALKGLMTGGSVDSTSLVLGGLNGVFDFFLYTHGWPLIRHFATTHLWLRLRHGFKETEIVFRTPTGSSRVRLNELPPNQAEQAFGHALTRAIDRRFLAENPGFNTRSGFWVLDYSAANEAYLLQKHNSLEINQWELRVWQKSEEGLWTVWEAYRLHDGNINKLSMEVVKERLLRQGREDFVQKWEDLLQLGNKPGATDAEKHDVRQAVVYLFKSEGLNLEKLWTESMTEAQRRIAAI